LFEETLAEVPSYTDFLTADELNESSMELARERPDRVSILNIGRSQQGDKIAALKIGRGQKNALLFAFPHPDEPIGGMTLEYLSRRLAEDPRFDRLGYTWYVVKCIDPDGARLYEGWFKAPFTPLKMALNYYRPPQHQQVEWTFPVKYKNLVWTKPLPETKALMRLIEMTKPDFMYSLHNSGFGGVYFFISRPCKSLYPKLHKLVAREGLPLHLGEPELPNMKKFAEAVFDMPPTSDYYEFLRRQLKSDPMKIIKGGASSDEYASRFAKTFVLVCETPHFYDPKISDPSPSGLQRAEAITKGLDDSQEVLKFMASEFQLLKRKLARRRRMRPFVDAITELIETTPQQIEAHRIWASSDKDLRRAATVAEEFDSCTLRRFYDLLSVGLLHRCAQGVGDKETDQRVLDYMHGLNEKLNKQLVYETIPIRKLVRVQLGSALRSIECLKSRAIAEK
jgi:hypothetical protein